MIDQFAHASGTVAGGVLTTTVEKGAQLARTGQGVFTMTVNPGMGAPAESLRVTVSKANANTPVFHNIAATSQVVTTINFFDAAGAATDPDYLTVTLDRIPRIA